MTERQTNSYLFRHFHQVVVEELKVLIREEIPSAKNRTQKLLVEKHQATLESILESLIEEEPDPESIFQKALAALSEIDRERFLLENLLEAVKEGRSLNGILETYYGLGLTDIDPKQLPDEGKKESGTDVPASSEGAGKLLGAMLNRLKKVATKAMQLGINAMKVIARFVGVKPSIGFSGPFPTFSLQFELEMKSVTLLDIFQDLTRGFGTPR